MTCRGLLAPRVAAQPFGRLALVDEVPYRLERRGVRHELILWLDLKRQKLGKPEMQGRRRRGWESTEIKRWRYA